MINSILYTFVKIRSEQLVQLLFQNEMSLVYFSQPESDQAAFDQRFQTECDFLPPKVSTRLSHIRY